MFIYTRIMSKYFVHTIREKNQYRQSLEANDK